MKRFYKTWFADLNIKTRPKFKTPPQLTADKMKEQLGLFTMEKIPGILETFTL